MENNGPIGNAANNGPVKNAVNNGPIDNAVKQWTYRQCSETMDLHV